MYNRGFARMEVEDTSSDILSHSKPSFWVQWDLALWPMEDVEERALGNVLRDDSELFVISRVAHEPIDRVIKYLIEQVSLMSKQRLTGRCKGASTLPSPAPQRKTPRVLSCWSQYQR